MILKPWCLRTNRFSFTWQHMLFSPFPVQLRSPPRWAPGSPTSQLGVCSRVHITSPEESLPLRQGTPSGPCHTRGLFQKPQSPGRQLALPPTASCQKHQFSLKCQSTAHSQRLPRTLALLPLFPKTKPTQSSTTFLPGCVYINLE